MSSKTNVINSQQEKTPTTSSDLDASSASSRKRQSGGATAISSKTLSSESETKVQQPVASDKLRTTTKSAPYPKRDVKVDNASSVKVKPNNRPPPPLHKPPAPAGVAAVRQLPDKPKTKVDDKKGPTSSSNLPSIRNQKLPNCNSTSPTSTSSSAMPSAKAKSCNDLTKDRMKVDVGNKQARQHQQQPRQKSFVQNAEPKVTKPIQMTPKGGSPPKSSSPKKFSPNTNKRSSAAMHRQRSFIQNENDKSSSSPGFHRRSKTQLEIRPRKRNTSSTSSDNSTPTILNPQAKEFVMKNEVQGLPTGKLTIAEKSLLSDALNSRNKIRALIELPEVIIKALHRNALSSKDAIEICIKILETDTGETFMESLLNGLQQHYTQFESQNTNSTSSTITSMYPECYVVLMCELYPHLKRKQQFWNVQEEEEDTNATLVFLSLLSEWCQQVLSQIANGNPFQQIDLFTKVFILIGRDLSGSYRWMDLMFFVREAFLCTENGHFQNRLLHLIELQSGNWQLSSDAATYYYPVASSKDMPAILVK